MLDAAAAFLVIVLRTLGAAAFSLGVVWLTLGAAASILDVLVGVVLHGNIVFGFIARGNIVWGFFDGNNSASGIIVCFVIIVRGIIVCGIIVVCFGIIVRGITSICGSFVAILVSGYKRMVLCLIACWIRSAATSAFAVAILLNILLSFFSP